MGGLELDRSPNSGLQGLPPSFDEGYEGLAVEAVRRLSLQLERRRECLSGGRAGLAGGDQAHVRRERQALREPGPRRRMSRIEADGLLEGPNGPAVVLLGVPTMLAQQVAAIGFQVSGLRSGVDGSRSRSEPGLHGLDDAGGDLVLHGEYVLQLPVEALGPDLVARGDLAQLGGDAQLAAGRPHAALQHLLHREHAPDPAEVLLLPARPEGRGPRRHADSLDADECVHDLLGHSLAEVLLVFAPDSCPRTAAPRSPPPSRRGALGSDPAPLPPVHPAPPCASRRSGAPRTRAPTTSR